MKKGLALLARPNPPAGGEGGIRRPAENGFTLIEMLVVIVIIGVLMSVGLFSYAGIGKSARDTKRKDDLNTLQKEFEAFYQINGAYPVGDDADECFASLIVSIPTAIHPTDPDDGSEYTWHNCSAQAYCLCTTDKLEIQKGNASDLGCTFVTTGGDYYCVRNQQTTDSP
jgi:prepilin-type N-terminal cleavage/methylation domain-containing protein